ncbi:hypothetical protein cyc_00664 [Cyclospora cayetanensis]|uniref:Uncharacterized protein n=1 Tax=Cyclospora cayetanensis TaxID=88456 RepID=A0A1D3CR70_9EIME|nr:hypothetical protein cyc_00664 [Cyclospora cayetanensis]
MQHAASTEAFSSIAKLSFHSAPLDHTTLHSGELPALFPLHCFDPGASRGEERRIVKRAFLRALMLALSGLLHRCRSGRHLLLLLTVAHYAFCRIDSPAPRSVSSVDAISPAARWGESAFCPRRETREGGKKRPQISRNLSRPGVALADEHSTLAAGYGGLSTSALQKRRPPSLRGGGAVF